MTLRDRLRGGAPADARPAGDPARQPWRSLLAFGVPLLVAAASSVVASAVDLAMIGQYGALDLAAVSAASAFFDILANLVVAACTGFQILAPRLVVRPGHGILDDSRRRTYLLAGGVAGLAFAAVVAGGVPVVRAITDAGPELTDVSQPYLLTRAVSLFLLVPFVVLGAQLTARTRTREVMVSGVVLTVANVALDAVLIYGAGPLPDLGALGSGIGTSLATALAVGYLALAAARLRTPAPPDAAPPAGAPDPDGDGEAGFETSVVRLSWPAMLSTVIDYLGIAVLVALAGRFGADALAGARIALEIEALAFTALAVFCAGARVYGGRALGARDVGLARFWWRRGMTFAAVLSVPVTAVLVVAPGAAVRVFSRFPEVVDAARTPVLLLGLAVPVMGLATACVGMLRACGRTRWEMYVNVGSVWLVQLPVAWLVAVVLDAGVAGVFWGNLAYWTVRYAVSRGLVAEALRREAAVLAAAARPAPTPAPAPALDPS